MTTEKLMQDLRVVATDAEDVLKATAGQTGEQIEKVRARAEETLLSARTALRNAGARVDETVRQSPWVTAGIAAAIGLALGVLLAKK